MDRDRLRELLEAMQAGRMDVATAMDRLRTLPYENLGFARVDLHRALRAGMPEAVFCPGKTREQIVEIVSRLAHSHRDVMVTRCTPEIPQALRTAGLEVEDFPEARIVVANPNRQRELLGCILVAAAGTSDLPVAAEAAVAAEVLGNRVERLWDVGVAGLHRLLDHHELLHEANVIIAVAGMEGALPSVIGGLVDRPVIAVPTSVGYGASFGGIAALLAMLNSCAPGVSVVNIDNGFGAAVQASQINKLIAKSR